MVSTEQVCSGEKLKVIDISQPISSNSACFPGDVPFKREVTLTFEDSKVVNLTALTMSPHVGTHADSPVHVQGSLSSGEGTAASMPLSTFVGPCCVVDVAEFDGAITAAMVKNKLPDPLPPRVLFRTLSCISYDQWKPPYAYFSLDLVDFLRSKNVTLMGIDTPSVDHIDSKQLEAHHRLLGNQMYWLENLDLTQTRAGRYFLVALPLKFMELEASPVRAVLLDQS